MNGRALELVSQAEAALDHGWPRTKGMFPRFTREEMHHRPVSYIFTQSFKQLFPESEITGNFSHAYIKTPDGFLVDATYLQFSKKVSNELDAEKPIMPPNSAPKILVAKTQSTVVDALTRAEIDSKLWPFWLDQLAE